MQCSRMGKTSDVDQRRSANLENSGGEDGSRTRLDGFAGRFGLYESKS